MSTYAGGINIEHCANSSAQAKLCPTSTAAVSPCTETDTGTSTKEKQPVRWADRHACMRVCTLTASDLSALLARSEVQQNACRMTRSPQPTLAPTRCWWLSALRLHSSRLQHHQRRPMPLLMRLWLWLRLILRGQACRNDSLRPLLQWLRGVVLQVLV